MGFVDRAISQCHLPRCPVLRRFVSYRGDSERPSVFRGLPRVSHCPGLVHYLENLEEDSLRPYYGN